MAFGAKSLESGHFQFKSLHKPLCKSSPAAFAGGCGETAAQTLALPSKLLSNAEDHLPPQTFKSLQF